MVVVMMLSPGNLSDGANHAWLTATFASTGVDVQEIVMVPDKATGIAKGSAFVFVLGKKVNQQPTHPISKPQTL